MDGICAALTSPSVVIALLAAAVWAPVTGFPTWPAISRGRFSGTMTISALVGWTAFVVVRRLAVGAGS